jgi:hypothetical protein
MIKKSYSRLSQLYQNDDTCIAARFLHGAKDEEIIAHNIPSDVTWTCCRLPPQQCWRHAPLRGQSAADLRGSIDAVTYKAAPDAGDRKSAACRR